ILMALGASPGALVVSGCGCHGIPNDTVTLNDLLQMREYVRLGADALESGCNEPLDGDAGGAGGLGGTAGREETIDTSPPSGTCTANLPPPGTGDPADWWPQQIDNALSWDPNSGCPTPIQFEALSYLYSPDKTMP